MTSGRRTRTERLVPVAAAASLAVAALALVPSWRDEHRLSEASAARSPVSALDRAVAAQTPNTLSRARAIEVVSLVRLGRLRDAERIAAAEVARRPDDAFAARRLYEVQRLRGDGPASAATLRTLRRLDPLFSEGTGG